MARSLEPSSDHTCTGGSHASSLTCPACCADSRLAADTRPCPERGCPGVLFGDERDCCGGRDHKDRRPGPDSGEPIPAVSRGTAPEPHGCMHDAALAWWPLVLELRAAMAVCHPSPTTVARAAVDAYPKLDSYGLYLACCWACTPTPIGA